MNKIKYRIDNQIESFQDILSKEKLSLIETENLQLKFYGFYNSPTEAMNDQLSLQFVGRLNYHESQILINNLFVEFMSNFRDFSILCLSIIMEMIPIYYFTYQYLSSRGEYNLLNLILTIVYLLILIIRLTFQICFLLLVDWYNIIKMYSILSYQANLLIILIQLCEQILLIFDTYPQLMTCTNLILTLMSVVYYNIQITYFLTLQKSKVINRTILVSIMNEIMTIIIIHLFLFIQNESLYHYQNVPIYILTLLCCRHILLYQQINKVKNLISGLILLQFIIVLFELNLLSEIGSQQQIIFTLTSLLNLYNLCQLCNQSNYQIESSLEQNLNLLKNESILEQQTICNFCTHQIVEGNVQRHSELLVIFDIEIAYYTSCSHIYHIECAQYENECKILNCSLLYSNYFQQNYHYQVSQIINEDTEKFQYNKQHAIIIILIFIQIIHLIYLPYATYLENKQILTIVFNIIPSSLVIVGTLLFRDQAVKNYQRCLFSLIYALKYCAMRFFIYIIINVMIADHNIYSRLVYLLFIDINNLILELLKSTLKSNINIMTLFDLLFSVSEFLVLYNVLGSLIVIVIFVNLQNINCFVALIVQIIAIYVLLIIKSLDLRENKRYLIEFVLINIINICLVTYVFQYNSIQQQLDRNQLFFIWSSIFILFYFVKVNLKSNDVINIVKYNQMAQNQALQKIVYRGFQLKTQFICWYCGQIQLKDKTFVLFIFCQHTYHRNCLFFYLNQYKIYCKLCYEVNRFNNKEEQYLFIEQI